MLLKKNNMGVDKLFSIEIIFVDADSQYWARIRVKVKS